MKRNLLIGAAVVIVLILVKDKLPKVGDYSIGNGLFVDDGAGEAVYSPFSGRWDEVRGIGYIRFTDSGVFRGEMNEEKIEGAFRVLAGSAMEFTIKQQVVWPGKSPEMRMTIQECKFALQGDMLYLENRLFAKMGKGHFQFRKGTDAFPERSSHTSSFAPKRPG